MDTQRKADTVEKMAKQTKTRRTRRTFSDEFKQGAVHLVLDEKKGIAEVARNLDLWGSVLRGWVKRGFRVLGGDTPSENRRGRADDT